jgi:hypothetical protein
VGRGLSVFVCTSASNRLTERHGRGRRTFQPAVWATSAQATAVIGVSLGTESGYAICGVSHGAECRSTPTDGCFDRSTPRIISRALV